MSKFHNINIYSCSFNLELTKVENKILLGRVGLLINNLSRFRESQLQNNKHIFNKIVNELKEQLPIQLEAGNYNIVTIICCELVNANKQSEENYILLKTASDYLNEINKHDEALVLFNESIKFYPEYFLKKYYHGSNEQEKFACSEFANAIKSSNSIDEIKAISLTTAYTLPESYVYIRWLAFKLLTLVNRESEIYKNDLIKIENLINDKVNEIKSEEAGNRKNHKKHGKCIIL